MSSELLKGNVMIGTCCNECAKAPITGDIYIRPTNDFHLCKKCYDDISEEKKKANYNDLVKCSTFGEVVDLLFKTIDSNNSGCISVDETTKFLKGVGETDGSSKVIQKMMDTNKDGKVSKEELIDFIIKITKAGGGI
uniref:EF-hand domain-containing protein n=1 Tax=Lotharella oceanica TaxID=641309 RepID=A0A7S2XA19_9EUKA|mmetsp:Transcript_22076/g.41384  ORF Transcript_22076/g.41384 Transcript_22076/m.41384 type:complete len:137 (+) Transcript_22076:59-469(+)